MTENYSICLNILSQSNLSKHLEIKESFIKDSGNGVFCKNKIYKNQIIIEYTGRKKRFRSKENINGDYHMLIKKEKKANNKKNYVVIDGDPNLYPEIVSFGSFINHSESNFNCNFYFLEDCFEDLINYYEPKYYVGNIKPKPEAISDRKLKEKIFVVAEKDILPGEELLVNYGDEYFESKKEYII